MTIVARFKHVGAIAMVLAFMAPGGSRADAQTVAEFYRGNRISIIVGVPPGGSYDLNARTLARYMPRYIPGNPTIIVQNIAGANSMIAANHIYNIAPQDGTVIGASSRTMPYAPLLGMAGAARYDANRLFWLGSTAAETGVTVAWHTAPVKTTEDLFTTELIVGATDPGGDLYLFPHVLNTTLGTKFKIVPGYGALPPIGPAMERGEIQGVGTYNYMSLPPHWLREKKAALLLQFGTKRHPDLPDLPLPMDFAKTEEQRQILNVFMSMKGFGFPFFVAPDVPSDRVQALRNAFLKTMRDPEFQAEQKQQTREVSPASGEEMQQSLRAAYALPAGLIEKMRTLVPK
jgi:tripartite-type tricarboxylate transporter receptor subunit TctC